MIKPASLDTVSVLLRLVQEYYTYDHLDFEEDIVRSAVRELLSNKPLGQIWLIYQGSVPIRYVVLTLGYSLEFGGQDAFIDELYIQEPFRGQGIGAIVLALVEAAARSVGIRALYLEVECENRKAQRFYRAQGFEDREHFLLMSKEL